MSTYASRSERIVLAVAAVASLLLRALAFFRYRFDSDEPQHLHVAWGWTAGLVQYRDYFDNHAPLFHMLTAPLLALVGERSDVLLWMRLPMLVLFAVVLWGTWRLGVALYDERVAAWAVVLLSLFPPFFLKSLEYRTDNLWNALWMLAVLALLLRPRMFLGGLLLGCAFAVSLKTTLLLVTLGGAALVTRFLGVPRVPRVPRSSSEETRTRGTEEPEEPRNRLLLFAAGFILVPTALTIYFASVGAWERLLYCVFEFNSQVAATRPHAWLGRAAFPILLAIVLFLAWRYRATEHRLRYFFAVGIGIFTATLTGFWILISPRDFLPIMPLLAIFGAAAIARSGRALPVFAAVVVVFAIGLYRYADRFENRTDEHITMLDQLLRLSHPGERIIDVKGELIFRQRATYPIFEAITRAQLVRGMVQDTIAEDVVRTRAYVAQADGPMWPPRGRAFLSEHFVNLGRLRASGQWIGETGTFTIALPGEYVVLSEAGEAQGTLDGTPYSGARTLAAGTHRFDRAVAKENVVVLWAPAFRRGHSPFRLRDLEF